MKIALSRFRYILYAILTAALFALLVFGGAAAYASYYRGKVYPGVYYGNTPVGGLNSEQLVAFLENSNNRLAKEGVTMNAAEGSNLLASAQFTTVSGGENALELIKLDSARGAEKALARGRSGSWLQRLFLPLVYGMVSPQHLAAPLVVSNAALEQTLKDTLGPFEDKTRNATLKVSLFNSQNPEIIPEASGRVFDYSEVASALKKHLANLEHGPLAITRHAFVPTVTATDVASVMNRVPRILSFGNLNINFVDPGTRQRHDFTIQPAVWINWLEVHPSDSGMVIGLAVSSLENYLDTTIRLEVDQEAADAKFVMEEGKVKEFQASRSGLKMDIAKTAADLSAVFEERNFEGMMPPETVSVSVDITEPTVKTADVNDLGITDIIGVGISTFKDSHTNRIKNIAHAIAKLNGVLIKPGENFSTLDHIGPFDQSSGYLPEMVIKGKEIKPEIGGGMCQIGTTMFRLAMNSGMDITERRNHSLVVSYYADPVNKNPGTDATVYDPSPDFRFMNDTGNYLLLQTDIDYAKQQLTFTLWGKPDGRSGSYTHPLVSKWIPAGEPVETIVTDGSLKPGQKKCQEPFRGAVASFTYTRFTSSSEKIDRVFESYYRPLPRICMVGALPGSASSTPEGLPPGSEVIPLE